ncbi:unnamed protein product [Clavelina lepadiformis]|uniref:Uncharacterized protein n=1 Tax=Clavelina lepadiformis TaxID=159417 RepID=A0ABP0G5L4_CLALP
MEQNESPNLHDLPSYELAATTTSFSETHPKPAGDPGTCEATSPVEVQQVLLQTVVSFGTTPIQVTCNSCHNTVYTNVDTFMKSSAILLTVLLCCIGVVGGPCQLYHYWTSWTSKDTPEKAGDFEPRGYVCGGAKPIAIQVRRIVDRAAYDSTNNLVKISVDSGFSCFNAERPAENWRCDDFEVSYCCPLFLLPREAS